MAVGLEKYLVSDNKKYYDAARSVLYDADKFKAETLSSEGWELLKDLICEEKHFRAIMDILKDAYTRFCRQTKNGNTTKEDQKIVSKQVEHCNNMIQCALNELAKEGRVILKENSKNKNYKLKSQNKKTEFENDNELILK